MKPLHKKIIIGVGIIILLLMVGGGGKYSFDYHKREIKKKDSLIKVSQDIQKQLSDEIEFSQSEADHFKNLSNQLEQKNIQLYEKLKIKEISIRKRDTSFINNAGRISDGVNRYFKESDSIR